MTEALKSYQKLKDEKAEKEVKQDAFTKDVVREARLPKNRRVAALRVAATLASSLPGGVADPYYKKTFPEIARALGQGHLLTSLGTLAKQMLPNFGELVATITELTAREFEDFLSFVQGRLDGILALKRLFESVDFTAGNNEKDLHELFKQNVWLIDPTFTQFLTSNQSEKALQKRLSKELEIDESASNVSTEHDRKRPDLVFALANEGLQRVIVIELKAPNKKLETQDLEQLKSYLRRIEEYLESKGEAKGRFRVVGYLIGSRGNSSSKAEGVRSLFYEEKNRPDSAAWTVFDISEVLDKTLRAHSELMNLAQERGLLDDAEE
jgi:hypothetical protein